MRAMRADMGEHDGERCRRDPVDPRRLPQRGGPDGVELLRRLGGKPGDGAIVEIGGKRQRLVPPEGHDVGLLPVEIAGILGVDLELLDNIGFEGRTAPARWRRAGEIHARQAQQIDGRAPYAVLPDRDAARLGLRWA